MTAPVPVAFYAPMKPPDHPAPSGDRAIARLTLSALRIAGFDPIVVSDLRVFDRSGDADRQHDLSKAADVEVDRLTRTLKGGAPRLWFTYHCYHKAPDLIGPKVSSALGIPYAISEPSLSPRRRAGPWAMFARASEEALAQADILFWTTSRDRPALEQAGLADKMRHLPAFLHTPPAPAARPSGNPLRLLTVAMMRPGDKMDSYRRIATGLARLAGDWRLDVVGDGEARPEVEAALAPFANQVTFHGVVEQPDVLQKIYRAADLFLWPGVGEGVGMVYLEAQAAGVPVIAENHTAQADLIANSLARPGDADALADLIRASAGNRIRLSAQARTKVDTHHTIDAAADVLRRGLEPLIA